MFVAARLERLGAPSADTRAGPWALGLCPGHPHSEAAFLILGLLYAAGRPEKDSSHATTVLPVLSTASESCDIPTGQHRELHGSEQLDSQGGGEVYPEIEAESSWP